MAEKKEEKQTFETALEALHYIQIRLNAPKNQFNSYGNYHYRSCEDILAAVKPLLEETGCVLRLTDEVVQIGVRFYLKATAQLVHTGSGTEECGVAYAREGDKQGGMSESQITGSASTYARKYALNGLFCLDDTKIKETIDPDTQPPKGKEDADRKIDEKTVAIIEEMAKNQGLNKENVLKYYKIKSLADMTEAMYVDMLRRYNEGKK